jgi:hypothetical protein
VLETVTRSPRGGSSKKKTPLPLHPQRARFRRAKLESFVAVFQL